MKGWEFWFALFVLVAGFAYLTGHVLVALAI